MPKQTGIFKKRTKHGFKYYGAKWFQRKTYVTSLYPTADEAVAAREELIENLKKGKIVDKKNITVTEFIKLYLKEYLAHKTSIEENTFKKIESELRNGIIPYIGDMRLQELTPMNMDALQNELLKKYMPGSARTIITRFKQVLNRARIWKYIAEDPSLDLDSITVEFEEPEIFTTEQLALILQNENIPIRDRTFIGFGGLAGMRESEIAGLLWIDFHPDFDYIKLQRQHYLGKIKPLKSKRGKKKKERTVPIIEDLKLLIKEWKLQCPHTLREWVFPGRFGSKPINVVTWIRNHYKPILKECDLPYRKFHSLRHSFDTMMHDMGVPTREIMQILGHKSAKMTLDVYDRESPQRLIEVTRQIKVLDTSFLRKSLRK